MLRKLWIQLRSSLWFVPTLLVLAAVFLAVGLVQIDIAYAHVLAGQSWQPLLNAGAEGARGMLTAIAGSMITVAGVAFSVTIVTLSLASTQYTPRILRNFMRDSANQFVLGSFVAIFTYCLIVLRTIRGGAEKDGGGFVPLLAIAFGMLLALVSIGCLIFFIHHVATSIQASTILKTIADETTSAIERVYPHEIADTEETECVAESAQAAEWHTITAHYSGYLQHINHDGLLQLTDKYGALLRLDRIPGDFVAARMPLASVSSALDEEAVEAVRGFFVVGDFRTAGQDVGFGIRQIVDIGMKALSPGVNDTSTAVSCLDYLSVLLSQLATRRLVPSYLLKDDRLCIVASAPSFADYVAKSFDEIRLSADANVTIVLHMLCALRRVASVTPTPSRKRSLLEHARVIAASANASVAAPYDRERINEGFEALRGELACTLLDLPALSAIRTSGD